MEKESSKIFAKEKFKELPNKKLFEVTGCARLLKSGAQSHKKAAEEELGKRSNSQACKKR